MALTDSTTFYGEDAKGFFKQALTSSGAKSMLTLLPGVKSKIKLASYDMGNIIQDDSCSWAATGEGTLAQKTMEVCDLNVQLEFCTTIWEQNYLSAELKAGSNGAQLPGTFQEFLLSSVAEKLGADLEKIVFRGDTGTTSYPISKCDGLVTLALADSDVIDVSKTASLTVSNVVTELNRVLSVVPSQIREKEDFVIFIAQNIAFLYKQAQAAQTGFNAYVGEKQLDYMGYKLVPTNGLNDGQAIALSLSNAFYLTDLAGDAEEIKMINMYDSTGVRQMRVTTAFKFGVDYMFGEEIVLLS